MVDGVPFHIEGRRSLDDVLVRTRPPRGRSGQARRADRDGHSGRERTVMSEQDAFDRILASVHDARHCQLVVGSALLPREIDASDRSQQAHVTASHSTNARVRSRRW